MSQKRLIYIIENQQYIHPNTKTIPILKQKEPPNTCLRHKNRPDSS